MFTLLLYLKHLYKLGLLTLNIDLNLSFSFISEESKQTMVIVINGNLGVWQKGKTQEPLTLINPYIPCCFSVQRDLILLLYVTLFL